jgi:thiol-disulfide isomerase/thioredoxin
MKRGDLGSDMVCLFGSPSSGDGRAAPTPYRGIAQNAGMGRLSTVRSFVSRRRALGAALAAGSSIWLPKAAHAAHVVRPWPAARPVPELDLADLEGKPWNLAAHAGQVVVLNFWATWCEPCRLEMPSLEAMAAKLRPQGLVVCAVNYKESAAVIRQFLERMPFKPTILLDADGDATSDWTPRVFPSSVLIGRNGKPASVVVGELDWVGSVAKDLLDPLLTAPSKA